MTWFKDESVVDVLYKQASALEDLQPERFSSVNRTDLASKTLGMGGVLSGNRHMIMASRALRPTSMALKEKALRMQTLKARGLKTEDIPRPIDSHVKTAGLFMKPSDLADHRNLASVLEGALSNSNQTKNFKKHASVDPYRVAGAVTGAAVGATSEYLRQQYVGKRNDPIPPPQPVEGTLPEKTRALISNAKNQAEDWSRKNPMTSVLASTATGAVAGGVLGSSLPNAYKNLVTTIKNIPVRP
jgi:hypothetical protein